MKAVASEITGQAVEEIEDADIANRNPFLEGDFVIGDDEEWEEVPLHRVKIHDTKNERTFEVDVPEVGSMALSSHVWRTILLEDLVTRTLCRKKGVIL
jgi:hypothetical protein